MIDLSGNRWAFYLVGALMILVIGAVAARFGARRALVIPVVIWILALFGPTNPVRIVFLTASVLAAAGVAVFAWTRGGRART